MRVADFEKRFNDLKDEAIELLEGHRVGVKKVVYKLSTLYADENDQHRVYLEKNCEDLRKCEDHWHLFGKLNFYWNYLSYHLLDHLIQNLSSLEGLKNIMEKYKSDLQEFRVHTPLDLFHKTQKQYIEPPEGFSKIVAEFKKPESKNMSLEDVENFRIRYAGHYRLRDFALMVGEIRPGCFIVSFIVPDSILEVLKSNIPKVILQEYNVTKLHVGKKFYMPATLFPRSAVGAAAIPQRRERESRVTADAMVSSTRSLQSKPTISDLQCFQTRSGSTISIIERIVHYRPHWRCFIYLGIYLLRDEDIIRELEFMHNGDYERIIMTILSMWLHGWGREPATWAELIRVLNRIGLLELAIEIEMGL